MDGPSAQPSTMTQTSIPEYANPYVQAMLGQAMKTVFDIRPVRKAEGGIVRLAKGGNVDYGYDAVDPQTDPNSPYVIGPRLKNKISPSMAGSGEGFDLNDAFDGFEIVGLKPPPVYEGFGAESNRVAGLSNAQQEALNRVSSFQKPFLGDVEKMERPMQDTRDFMANVGYNALNTKDSYTPNTFKGNYRSTHFTPGYRTGQFDQDSFTDSGSADQFMNPYMQNVVDVNKREAIRDAGIMATQQQAQATQAGAFGGARDGIMRAEAQRNLGTRLSDIQNIGSQAAFTNAQQQFNTEAARNFAAQQAREQAKQFGTSASMQAQQLGDQSRQFGANIGLQAQQMGEQSRQFGANIRQQNLQQALNAAVAHGQMTQAEADQRLRAGQQQFNQHAGAATLLSQMGGQQQALTQQQMNNAYGDFVNQQNYPYKQMGFISDMSRGLPLANVSTFQAPPSAISQLAGLGTAGIAGLGLYNATR